MTDVEQKLRLVQGAQDPVEKALLLAALVTGLFREAGVDLVVVGGSAIEFYTEGAYMSGDIDLCRVGPREIGLRISQDLMGQIGGTGGPRSWKVAGLFVDLLGEVESEARTPFREQETPIGPVKLIQPEMALVERVLVANYPARNPEADECARKMMAVCVGGAVPVDWDEIRRLSALRDYGVGNEVERMAEEVRRALGEA